MNISTIGLGLLQEFEGCKLKAYPDPGTGGKPWTIGVGHTKDVQEGDEITEAQAMDLLREDIQWVEKAIDKHVPGKLTQNQYDALCCFIFNVGEFAFASSTLLKKLNAGDFKGAAAEFLRWDKAAGKTLPGLTRRRIAEAALFGS